MYQVSAKRFRYQTHQAYRCTGWGTPARTPAHNTFPRCRPGAVGWTKFVQSFGRTKPHPYSQQAAKSSIPSSRGRISRAPQRCTSPWVPKYCQSPWFQSGPGDPPSPAQGDGNEAVCPIRNSWQVGLGVRELLSALLHTTQISWGMNGQDGLPRLALSGWQCEPIGLPLRIGGVPAAKGPQMNVCFGVLNART